MMKQKTSKEIYFRLTEVEIHNSILKSSQNDGFNYLKKHSSAIKTPKKKTCEHLTKKLSHENFLLQILEIKFLKRK